MYAGFQLLFDAGKRPDLAEFCEVLGHNEWLSIDASSDGPDIIPIHWAGVVCDGLTFDVTGLAPGLSAEPLSGTHAITDSDGTNRRFESEAVTIRLGPHLRGAEGSMPVVKTQWQLAGQLAKLFTRCHSVIWCPAKIEYPSLSFIQLASDWTDKGMLPTLGLIRFVDEIDSGLRTVGLTFFTGQELRLEPGGIEDRDRAKYLGTRLVEALIFRERLVEAEEFIGPDGSRLRLVPSKNGKFVRVWRAELPQ